MLNAKQKAKKWIDENVVLSENCDIEYSDLYSKLEVLLKEQDRDTRHVCAEKVIQCRDMNDMCGDTDEKWIDVNDAQKACVNVSIV